MASSAFHRWLHIQAVAGPVGRRCRNDHRLQISQIAKMEERPALWRRFGY